MATVSRSAVEFMRRCGIVPTPRVANPRLDMSMLKTDRIPLDRDQLDPSLMLDAAGSPPPDRGLAAPWPPTQEVS